MFLVCAIGGLLMLGDCIQQYRGILIFFLMEKPAKIKRFFHLSIMFYLIYICAHFYSAEERLSLINQYNLSLINQFNLSLINQYNLSLINQYNLSLINQHNLSLINQYNLSLFNQYNLSLINQHNLSLFNQYNLS